jgi:hypothetical protein
MTKKHADKLATAMLHGLPVVEAYADDPRVLSGELVPDGQFHKTLSLKLRRTDRELKRAFRLAAYECEGKNQYEIADILGRAINGVMSVEMDLIDLEFL